MLRRQLAQASSWRSRPVCLLCTARAQFPPLQTRPFGATSQRWKRKKHTATVSSKEGQPDETSVSAAQALAETESPAAGEEGSDAVTKKPKATGKNSKSSLGGKQAKLIASPLEKTDTRPSKKDTAVRSKPKRKEVLDAPKSLKEALLLGANTANISKKEKKKRLREEHLAIQIMDPGELNFEPVEVDKPPVPMLSYGLDRVLFNPGVYRLQDPRSRIYNFDPYLEKIMPVHEFDFDALSEYKTSSKDQDLLDLTKRLGTIFTGSTSSMSSVLQHFHFLLSNFRDLNHDMLSRGFPEPSKRFSKITLGPDAVFLRYKDGIYAIDADKSYDSPNIMSWLGHSLEKLLTTDRSEFELFRRSSPEKAPAEDNSSRCYHYSKQGNVLMRSQLDAIDPRLPGTGVFDLKTRAVVSIRMNHKEYETGSGYQLRFAQGQWESYEREFYDMTRATLLKYSLQVRMGRMDGIFIAFHNIERIFGFQYLSLADMDRVLHGQDDTCLGDQEFKLSVALVDELLKKAIAQFPETSIRLHVEARNVKTPFMYVFAEPVTEEQADAIQGAGEAAQKDFARTVVGVGKDDPKVQEAWQNIQDEVDEQLDEDKDAKPASEEAEEQASEEDHLEEDATEQEVEEIDSDKPTNNELVDQPSDDEESGPLMGWTLTVRSKVNGGYVERPVQVSKDDDWQLEYHIQEIPEEARRKLYKALKDRRRALVGLSEEEGVDKSLQSYRDLIQRYSNRGRAWREEQDKMNEEMGVEMYSPLGPGSEVVGHAGGNATEKES
ncbi:mitochondrial protein Pet127-domain-containing protein [Paraphoma chrysanthemicola]|nr:mitochondrial protein Pet127-domain-containing protein [Paraphoma chrysanthemicola]